MKFDFNTATHIFNKQHKNKQHIHEAFDFMSELDDSDNIGPIKADEITSTVKDKIRYENLINYMSNVIDKPVDYEYEITAPKEYTGIKCNGKPIGISIRWESLDDNILSIRWETNTKQTRAEVTKFFVNLMLYCHIHQVSIKQITFREFPTDRPYYSNDQSPILFCFDSLQSLKNFIDIMNTVEHVDVIDQYSYNTDAQGLYAFEVNVNSETEAVQAKELMTAIKLNQLTCKDVIITINGHTNLESTYFMCAGDMVPVEYLRSRHINVPKCELVKSKVELCTNDKHAIASIKDMNITISRILMYIGIKGIINEARFKYGIEQLCINLGSSNAPSYSNIDIFYSELQATISKYNFKYSDFLAMMMYIHQCID